MIWLWLLFTFTGLFLLALVVFTAYTARRVEAALPPAGSFVTLGTAILHVVDQGQGPPVLLIHGIAGNLRHFTYGVAQRLAVNHRVIAVDRPGCGYSTHAQGAPLSLQAQADMMAQLLDALQIDRAVVAGHSLGGAVALALAQRHPQRVAALALVAPLTRRPEQASPAFKALAITHDWLRRAMAWTLATPASIARRDEILKMVFGPETPPRDFAMRGGGLMALRPSHFVTASRDLQAVASSMPTIEAACATLRVPVHVLFGRGDRILDHRANGVDLLDRLPGTQLQLVEGGHMLPITQPQTTADFIRAVASQSKA